MYQSLKSIMNELDWIRHYSDLSKVPSLNNGTRNRNHFLTSNSIIYYRDDKILLGVHPKHLSTYPIVKSIILSSDTIELIGGINVELPLRMTEETYFQQSLLTDLNDIPIEFVHQCETTFDLVLGKINERTY